MGKAQKQRMLWKVRLVTRLKEFWERVKEWLSGTQVGS